MKKKTADRPTFDTNRMRTVAIAYYPDEDAWRRMRRVVSDPDGLGENYEAWQVSASGAGRPPRTGGRHGDPGGVGCRRVQDLVSVLRGGAADATARSLFAAEKMRG
jgi:hypothetical protein